MYSDLERLHIIVARLIHKFPDDIGKGTVLEGTEVRTCTQKEFWFEWLRVSNLVRCTHMGSKLVIRITNHKLTANLALHPSDIEEGVLRGSSEAASGNARPKSAG